MPKVIFHHHDGRETAVDAEVGSNLMRAAVQNSVDGIVGECGGQAMCATCHVYVRPQYLSLLDPIGEDEEEMLDCTSSPRDDTRSRLGCQVTLTDGVDEIAVDVPETQI